MISNKMGEALSAQINAEMWSAKTRIAVEEIYKLHNIKRK